MTSALRVLVCGDHPNLILYTSRFQHAKNIEFYLVNNSVSAAYEINSLFYGTERFQIQNHFQSLLGLVDLNRNGGLVFDLVIMSASSLQEIPQTLRNLKPMINNTTKILFESSGFVYLEPFIKASVDLPLSNIFSIFTDYDVRRLDRNSYKQFATANSKSFSISIGQTTAIQESSYSKDIIPILNTFQKLFQKLFPKDIVTLYDYSPLTFLTKQWELAIPQICFDPLLIILEEKLPSNLDNNVLAKPLISGLLEETLSLIRKMGITFTNPHFQNEQTILKYWKEKYEGVSDIPTFLYYFIHKSSPLNIDLLLLQPILLADDFGIKTPYLECLFTMMSQYQLLNGGNSDWFIRKNSDITLTNSNDLQNDITLKDGKIMQLQNLEKTLRNQIKQLQSQVVNLKQEISLDKSSHEQELDVMKKKIQSRTNELPDGNLSYTNTNGITSSDNMTNGDVSYEKSDHGNNSSINDSRRQSFFNSTSDTTLSRDETSLKERELEVRKKELELQERELELQKRALQQQQQYQQRPPKQAYIGPPGTPGTPIANINNNNNNNNNINNNNINNNRKGYNASRKSSYSQPQHMAMASSRGLHGPSVSSPSPAFSANNFVDPIFPGASYAGNNGRFSQQAPPQQYMHAVKPTSRKNRNSVMPNIGYVPGMANNEYGRKLNGNANAVNGTQSRLNSLSNQSTFRSQQGPPTPQQKPFPNNGGTNIRPNRVSSANYNNLNQKPGFVNSVSSPNLNNFENNNNQQNFRNVDSTPCVNQLNNGSQSQLQPQPQFSASIPQINVTQPSPIQTNFTTNNNPTPVTKFGTPSEDTVSSAATSNNISAMTDGNSKEEVKEKKKKKFSFFGKKKK